MQIDYCCFMNRSGYAQAALDYIQCLKTLPYDLKISLLHADPERLSLSNERYLEFMSLMRKIRDTEAIQILHCIPEMQRRVPKTQKTIGFATFETYSPPIEWVNILNENDAIICPSEFNVKIFENAGIQKPIYYIPHCFNPELYNPNIPPLERDPAIPHIGEPDGRFVFLFIGTWKKRKGYQQLLEAWMQEFDTNDNVKLVIKTDRYTIANKTIQDTRINLGLQKKEIAPILLEGRVFNEVELPKFFKTANCLVCPTLGEGFGLPGLQCMALGIPVIVTNFSGVTDYANEHTATLIEHNGFVVYNDLDTIPQFRGKKWANITVQSIRDAMRKVINEPELAKQKAQNGLEYIKSRFTYDAVSTKLSEMLKQI